MFVCAECGASQPVPGACAADGTPLAPIGDDLLLGTTIGAYRVARLLGIGGMGRVYKGVHPTIGSRVAIKVLSRECSDRRDLVDRFFSEAKAVNVIRHESIVNVLDLAMLPDGRPYIIMEYLDGAPLGAVVEAAVQHGTPLPLGGLARLAAEVLDALGAAHAKGVIHRDLKPDNIYVAPSGRPKVLDFGIAKLSDTGPGSSTRTGSLLGTPHYMAPEQAAGKPVDLRADIYAMGVILFECATGTKPFTADSLFDLLRQHVEAPPPSPRARRHDMPPDLEHVILTALAKAPDQRFSSAQAMSVALQHATQLLPPAAWTPITSAGAAPTGSGWAPTPPQSWAGAGSRAPAAPGAGNAPPVSAGQVTAGPREPARPASGGKGAWLAVGAILLVGGGVTAAVLASRGGGSTPAPAQVAEPTPAPVPVPGPTPVPTPTPPPAPPVSSDDGADEVSDETMNELYATLDEEMKALPADQRDELSKYKDLAKLPPKERMKKLTELSARMAEDMGGIGKALGGGTRGPAQPAPAPGAWVERHDLDAPPGWNPKHVDLAAFIPWAIAQARREVPDAELYRIDVDGVSPDGFADLTLATLASDTGSVDLRFTSPSHARRDPKLPIGARNEMKCELRITAEPDGVTLAPMFASACKEKPVALPRCSYVALWKRALKKGAPQGAVANIGLRTDFNGRATWYFDIGFGTDVTFSELWKDDC